ncbi:MAG TPA: sulfate transporter family protein [Xanthobacteraceae bacterium]|jgi:CysZ protein|nr:sulfate transporter family protein [Xanthobacteraceae bacterium]
MFSAAAAACSQMLSQPFRAVLFKAIGLALILIVLIGIGIQRALVFLATGGEAWAEATLGAGWHSALNVAVWVISIAAGLGIIVGSVFLMPAVTSFVGSFFVDEIAERVEREHYPADPPGRAVPLPRAVWEGGKTALLSVGVYLVATPFLLFAGFGAVIFFVATAYLLGREYFELAAMRFHPADEAKRLRKMHSGTVFTAGLMIAAFVSIPIVNLATPLFAMALMVHIYKQVARQQAKLILPQR